MCHHPASQLGQRDSAFLREFSLDRGVPGLLPLLDKRFPSAQWHFPAFVLWCDPSPAKVPGGAGGISPAGLCSSSQGRAPTHLPHYQGLMEASSSSCPCRSPTLEHKQPLPTIPAPFQPVPSSSRCCLSSQHSSCSERTRHKSSVTLLLILSPSLVLLR